MRIKSFVLGGAALLSVAGLSAPALAFTHHPSTAAERKQTDDLNAQQLALARGQAPMQQQAAATMPEQNNAMTQTAAPEATAPQTTAPESTTPQSAPPASTPQPTENPQTNGSSPQQ